MTRHKLSNQLFIQIVRDSVERNSYWNSHHIVKSPSRILTASKTHTHIQIREHNMFKLKYKIPNDFNKSIASHIKRQTISQTQNVGRTNRVAF